MIRKPKFHLNWKYALGELFLIFMGISLAITFQNWNDGRKRLKLEEEVLTQIYAEILTNKGDVDGDFEQLVMGLQSHVNIEQYIAEDWPYLDSMCFDFYWIKQDEYAFPITGGYENLKSLGLDLIQNDSIRQFIQILYEFGYPRISRDSPFHPDMDEFFTPYYKQHFIPNEDTSLTFTRKWTGGTIGYPYWSTMGGIRHLSHIGYVPLDYEALKRDPEFKMLMHQARDYRRYKIRQYKNVKDISDILTRQIEAEFGVKPEEESP